MKKKRNTRDFSLFIQKFSLIFAVQKGGLAQLARALAWHARGHGFDSHILHKQGDQQKLVAFFVCEELHFTHPFPSRGTMLEWSVNLEIILVLSALETCAIVLKSTDKDTMQALIY